MEISRQKIIDTEKKKANDDRTEPTSSPGHSLGASGSESVGGSSRRLSAKQKLEAVCQLMRGKGLESVARELNVKEKQLSAWRDRVFLGARLALEFEDQDGNQSDK